ncbi:MAG: matrixin family metalloprotease [Actinobacteria bacterium]|nr:matrixin family metalloprotease [Actinomycetota bacterium]
MESNRADTVLRGIAIAALALLLLVGIASPAGLLGQPVSGNSAAPANREPDARSASDAATAAGYAFLLSSKEHDYPARWCAGTQLRYTIDFTQAGAAGLDPAEEVRRWQRAFSAWTEASLGQYTFVYEGEKQLSTVAEDDSFEVDVDSIDEDTIGITYVQDDDESQPYYATAVRGRTAGNGGIQVVSRGTQEGSALVGDKGFVMIDAEDAATLAATGLRETLYIHESGHSLGLGHVEAAQSIMNGTLSNSRPDISEADRQGVRALSRMPCER